MWPCAEDSIKKLLDALPCFQNIYLEFFCTANVPVIVHELFEDLPSLPLILVADFFLIFNP